MSDAPDCGPVDVATGFLPPVLDPILGDYKRNVAEARDAEVLGLFTVVVRKLKGHVEPEVPRIMDAVFEVTLQVRKREGNGRGGEEQRHTTTIES